uniref:CSON005631 protein n=1 Tax=Culicoides sonorensis TaxID=179676 RepID=A0A336LJT5_CULSO
MKQQKVTGTLLCMLVLCSSISSSFAYPQLTENESLESSRRYAEKPNNVKKVALDDIDQDIQTNQISDNPFSWTNMLGMVMQMMFNGNAIGPNKSDDLDSNGAMSSSPWANIISIGLRIITTLLGGNTNDGIDKVDNGAAGPMQASYNVRFLLVLLVLKTLTCLK